MPARCELCRRRITDRHHERRCECGWVMDDGCAENHDAWCPRHGEDRWVGSVEL